MPDLTYQASDEDVLVEARDAAARSRAIVNYLEAMVGMEAAKLVPVTVLSDKNTGIQLRRQLAMMERVEEIIEHYVNGHMAPPTVGESTWPEYDKVKNEETGEDLPDPNANAFSDLYKGLN